MHEISLVQSLIQQLKELAAANKSSRIITVTMEIGPLSGVVVDSFRFGFDILAAEDELYQGRSAYRGNSRGQLQLFRLRVHHGYCRQPGRISVGNAATRCLLPEGGDDLILRQVEME